MHELPYLEYLTLNIPASMHPSIRNEASSLEEAEYGIIRGLEMPEERRERGTVELAVGVWEKCNVPREDMLREGLTGREE